MIYPCNIWFFINYLINPKFIIIGHRISKLIECVVTRICHLSRNELINCCKEIKSKVEETIKIRGLEVNYILT